MLAPNFLPNAPLVAIPKEVTLRGDSSRGPRPFLLFARGFPLFLLGRAQKPLETGIPETPAIGGTGSYHSLLGPTCARLPSLTLENTSASQSVGRMRSHHEFNGSP